MIKLIWEKGKIKKLSLELKLTDIYKFIVRVTLFFSVGLPVSRYIFDGFTSHVPDLIKFLMRFI